PQARAWRHPTMCVTPRRGRSRDLEHVRASVVGGRVAIESTDMSIPRLVDRRPEITPDDLVQAMTPPPRFDAVRFDNYVPNPDEPTQQEAVDACRAFAERCARTGKQVSWWRGLFGWGRKSTDERMGMYLDGGFGVGKTHLLAS